MIFPFFFIVPALEKPCLTTLGTSASADPKALHPSVPFCPALSVSDGEMIKCGSVAKNSRFMNWQQLWRWMGLWYLKKQRGMERKWCLTVSLTTSTHIDISFPLLHKTVLQLMVKPLRIPILSGFLNHMVTSVIRLYIYRSLWRYKLTFTLPLFKKMSWETFEHKMHRVVDFYKS